MSVERLARWLAGVWAGVLICIGALAAPAAFAVLVQKDAGRLVGAMLSQEAYLSLLLGVVLLVIERRRAANQADAGPGSVLNANVLILLGAMFCTIAGHFAIQPMMAMARAGQGAVSFAVLHAVSASFFALKAALIGALAWRYSPR